MTPLMDSSLSVADLEHVYESLANALDRVGSEKSELFLVKLALLQAQSVGSATAFQAQMDAALRDL